MTASKTCTEAPLPPDLKDGTRNSHSPLPPDLKDGTRNSHSLVPPDSKYGTRNSHSPVPPDSIDGTQNLHSPVPLGPTDNSHEPKDHDKLLLSADTTHHVKRKPRHKLLSHATECDDIMYLSTESLCSVTIPGKEQIHRELPHDKNEYNDSETTYKNLNIDRGYAWVIVVAAGMTFFIGGGFEKGFTLMYHQLLTKFHSSATDAALTGSLFGCIKMFSSPVVTALLNRFGYRAVVITGGILSGFAFVWTAFPSSLVTVYMSYGVLAAIGGNMVHAPSMIIIGQYFDKRKGKAMAVTLMFLSLGGVLLIPLVECMFRYYGYTGTIWIYGGLILNYCVSGALFRPPPAYTFQPDEIIRESKIKKKKVPTATLR